MLSNCNTLSSTRLERAVRDFKAHTTHVMDMKRDLEIVLKRIRTLKAKVEAQNPEAFKGEKIDDGVAKVDAFERLLQRCIKCYA